MSNYGRSTICVMALTLVCGIATADEPQRKFPPELVKAIKTRLEKEAEPALKKLIAKYDAALRECSGGLTTHMNLKAKSGSQALAEELDTLVGQFRHLSSSQSRCDAKVNELFKRHICDPVRVKEVAASMTARLTLRLRQSDGDFALDCGVDVELPEASVPSYTLPDLSLPSGTVNAAMTKSMVVDSARTVIGMEAGSQLYRATGGTGYRGLDFLGEAVTGMIVDEVAKQGIKAAGYDSTVEIASAVNRQFVKIGQKCVEAYHQHNMAYAKDHLESVKDAVVKAIIIDEIDQYTRRYSK